MFKKTLRLPKKNFVEVLKTGKVKKVAPYYLYYKKNNLGYNRFGLVVSPKYFSSQVEKNLFKRRLTSIINKLNFDSSSSAYDLVIRVVGRPQSLAFEDLHQAFDDLITKI